MGYGCAEGAARIAKLLYNRSGSAQACCRHEALCLDASGLNTQRVPVALLAGRASRPLDPLQMMLAAGAKHRRMRMVRQKQALIAACSFLPVTMHI